MSNQITYGDDSRTAILRGINSLANAVRVTLGPRGRNVILGRGFGAPTITKDGVTVAKEISLKDLIENLGAQMIREWPARRRTWPATARPRPPCWLRRSTVRA